MTEKEKFDVIIAGGGLAGLTLAFQLTQSNSLIKILVLEKRDELAPVATHKVGESTSEIGAFYLRNVLGLGDYLEHSHLRKFGFRFFFSPENKHDISRRVEVGSRIEIPHPAYQIDRGIFENEVLEKIDTNKVQVLKGATIKDVEIDPNGHTVTFEQHGVSRSVCSKWLIDSTGRRGLLRRKLNLDSPVDHKINSAWFRIAEPVDIDNWSDDTAWKMHYGIGKRRFSTNHLMGEGYWFWIIPLVSSSTSFGIVADPRYHPFETFNTFEKAMDWLWKHEPHAAKMIEPYSDKLLDFKVMKEFSYDTRQFYSLDRWALTGEAATFLDPFYSPGSDFIALNNTWIADLITRDLSGENILMRTKIYELAHRELFNGWLTLYQDKYKLFNNTQVMLAKITWDWATYWGIPALMFMNNGYTDLNVLRSYSSSERSLGSRFALLNQRIQQFFMDWDALGNDTCSYDRVNTFSLKILYDFHMGLYEKHDPISLVEKITSNLDRLEGLYRAIFSKVATHVKNTPEDLPIDPYTMDLTDSFDELQAKSLSEDARIPDAGSKNDIEKIWLVSPGRTEISNKNKCISNIGQVERSFMQAIETAERSKGLSELIDQLENDPSDFRSIGFEGASFAIGSHDLETGNQLKNWEQFKELSDPAHQFHIDIGLGWAFAKTGKFPDPVHFDPMKLTMLYDGMGYYYALFKVRKTIIDQNYPTGLPSTYHAPFDRGIGRRMWYMAKGDLKELNNLVNAFPADRQSELWLGIGVAATYVGGISPEMLHELLEISGTFQEQFKTGAGLALLSRKRPQDRSVDLYNYTRALFNASPEGMITKMENDLNQIIPKQLTIANTIEQP